MMTEKYSFYFTLHFRPDWMAIDLDFANNLWLPNIFIYDLKEFKVNIVKDSNAMTNPLHFQTIHVLHKLAALYVVKEGEIIS